MGRVCLPSGVSSLYGATVAVAQGHRWGRTMNRTNGRVGWLAVLMCLVGVAPLTGCEAEAQMQVQEPPPPPPPPPPPVAAPAPLPPNITVSERIQFETDKAILLPRSTVVLQEVVKVMQEHPHVTLVEIGGHTDSTGDSGKNLLLSQERADAVKAFLVSQGIGAERLRSRGYGDRVPVADNGTPQGREQNRRVEFRIVEQGP